jgi:hypothetical protein
VSLLRILRDGLLPPDRDDDDVSDRLTLRRVHTAWLDGLLPSRPKAYVAVAIAIPLVFWCAGFLLASDRARFLRSHDWQAQPIFFTVHLVVLRLFVSAYVKHFLDGLAFLEPAAQSVRTIVARILGWRGFLVSLVVAAPLVWLDLVHLSGPAFLASDDSQGSPDRIAPADHLLGALWAVEWITTTSVWVVLVGFAAATIRSIQRFRFAAPLETVLHERHYRPFLRMSAQGASILLGYTAVYALYVWYTGSATSAYIGLWVTAGLLLLSFVPPWMRLKTRLARMVRDESHAIHVEVLAARARASSVDDGKATYTLDEVGAKVDVALSMLRLDHLEHLYRDLGKSEGQAILLRLLAPISTILLKVLRPG